MKRVIVIEDEVSRVDWLRQVLRPSGTEVVWCKTVAEFTEAAKQAHDLAIFDHDLQFGAIEPGLEETGQDAANAYNPPGGYAQTLVWSLNYYGAKAIEKILKRKNLPVIVYPFESGRMEALAVALKDMFGH